MNDWKEADKLNYGLEEPKTETIAAMKELHQKIRRRVLRLPGVTAIDIGYAVCQSKQRFDEQEKEPAIRIHVERKLGVAGLKERGWPDLTNPEEFPLDDPKITKAPEAARPRIGRFPLDIIEARYFPAQEIRVERPRPSEEIEDDELGKITRSRVNPLVGGVSIGNAKGQAGTLGAVVWDRTDGTACILSNWHVLAGSPSAAMGQPCFQPAIFDGGKPSDAVATLKRWCFGRDGDAALAEITAGRYYSSGEVLGLWHPLTGIIKPKLGMEVRKWGRTTGFTQGFIDGIDLATNIDYGNGFVRYFENQLHIAPLYPGEELSASGDSGSILVTRFYPEGMETGSPPDSKTAKRGLTTQEIAQRIEQYQRSKMRLYCAVGMIFAGDVPGSQFGEYAIASSMENLAELLEFSLRPVFVPRSKVLPQQRDLPAPPRNGAGAVPGSPSGMQPGAPAADERASGPHPDPEPIYGGG